MKGGGRVEAYMTWVWLGLLVLFAIVEGATVGLVSIWFAAGSAAALIVSVAGGPLWLQIVLFLAVSILCMLALRPFAQRFLKPGYEPTNADRAIGREAVVTEEIDNLNGRGSVTVGGVAWTARSVVEDAVIPAGATVLVERIEGVKLFVKESKEEVSCQSHSSF